MEVDVAVLGGGPAGCSAAITLAGFGLEVAILDSGFERRRPTETVPPEVAQTLSKIGATQVLSSFRPCFGISSYWGGSPRFQSSMLSPSGNSWFIDRSLFDRELRKISRSKGVSFVEAEAVDVQISSGKVTVSSPGVAIESRWAIFASGTHALASRITGQVPTKVDQLLCYWMPVATASRERVLTIEPADYGWWYACPEREGSASICLVTDSKAAREERAASPSKWAALFRKTSMFTALGASEPKGDLRVGDAGLSTIPHKTGQRWSVIGDAALKLDPLGSSGVMLGLDSGCCAASDVAAFLGSGTARGDSLDAWYNRIFKKFVRERRQHYLVEEGGRDSSFWSRRISQP